MKQGSPFRHEGVRDSSGSPASGYLPSTSSRAAPTPLTAWPVPASFDRPAAETELYPVEALPALVREAVLEYQAYGRQPMALVVSSALSVVSLATQGLFDIARDERLIGPLSLYFLVLAVSGERKTAADNAMSAALDDWTREREAAMADDVKRAEADFEAWDTVRATLIDEIRKSAKQDGKKVALLKEQLEEHYVHKPEPVIIPQLKYEDVNAQSLVSGLAKGYQTAALWSSEGAMVTGSHGMSADKLLGFMATINRLWDGGSIRHDRKQAESVNVDGRRFTVSLMMQPAVAHELVTRSHGLARGSGFLARYLVCQPPSTMGTRRYRPPPSGMPALTAFHERIRALLDCPLPIDPQDPCKRLIPPVLQLSTGAFDIWRDYHDEIEVELRPVGGKYSDLTDFAAKSADNAARIAGCLHVLAGAAGAIAADHMDAAAQIARWHLRESLRIIDSLDEPPAWTDARRLDAWLAEQAEAPDGQILAQRSPLRDKERRRSAIEVLIDLQRAQKVRHGRRELLIRNPALRGSATATSAIDRAGRGRKTSTGTEPAREDGEVEV